MHNHQVYHQENTFLEMVGLGLPFVFLIVIYLIAVYHSNKKYRVWPLYCSICWVIGVVSILVALISPLAELAHINFPAHMYVHLLLGMLGPLLLAFAAPVKLLLRTLPVKYARLLSKFLKSAYIRFISHPIIAGIINIGGLWILYTTDLYSFMHHSIFLYAFIHFHVFLAGYVFTISMIYIDLSPHRTSFTLRATTLVLAMAGHNILSKWIYAHPPIGIEKEQAERGAMTMYYGGDLIDLMIVIVLCYQHFKVRKYETGNKVVLT